MTDIVICGGLSFAISVILSWMLQPVPTLHDEFSYLLAGDTFASGRLANDTHPFWMHFESMHILQQPRYASKYPPMQGLFLAVGQILVNRPLAGVWLSTSFAVAAICWMLQGWVPRRWALFGGLMAAFHSGMQLEWGQSYMGGAPAVIGSALLYGALPRWRHSQSASSGIAGAVGLAVLANSRPFEGLLVSIPAGAIVLRDLALQIMQGRIWRCVRALVPGVGVLALTFAGMLFYNQQVTGNCLQLPYSLHSSQYMSGPLFVWQSPPAAQPQYHNAVMKEFHTEWEVDACVAQQTVGGFLRVKSAYYSAATFVLLSPLTLVAVSVGVYVWWNSRGSSFNVIIVALSLLIAGASSVVWVFPHYLAPGLPLLLLLAIHGLRHVFVYLKQSDVNSNRMFSGVMLACILLFLAQCAFRMVFVEHAWSTERARMIASLEHQPGKHLIIVQYSPQHSPHEEWVYNRADIDAASVIWARDLGAPENNRLMEYFSNRKVWTLAADADPAVLVPAEF